jgi:HEPN domain-containing protein
MCPTSIGIVRPIADAAVGSEYKRLADEDEAAARLLFENKMWRQASYFSIQAIEKYLRYQIFSVVSARHECLREMATTHNLDELIAFLMQIVVTNDRSRQQAIEVLSNQVLGGHRFGNLHNNARYPFARGSDHGMLEFQEQDARYLLERLNELKQCLRTITRR